MQVIHLADLHIGKSFHKKNLYEDQKYMLENVLSIMNQRRAHLVIAGDVFDSANPSIEAQELFVDFMQQVMSICDSLQVECIVIVGNHDSNRRLQLWSDFVGNHVHIVEDRETVRIEGVSFVNVSFAKPTLAMSKFGKEFESYDEAFLAYIDDDYLRQMHVLKSSAILVAHQTFEGCTTGSSEAMSFFDDAVSKGVVRDFPLVMAGHIHKKQKIDNIFYPGSLMPYAFGDEYSGGVTVWDIQQITNLATNQLELSISQELVPVPLFHEFQVIRGDLKHCLGIPDTGAYVKVELVDENISLDIALPELQAHFSNMVSAVSRITDDWEADLSKPMVQFDSIESALDSFCNQIDVPVLDTDKLKLVQEVVHEITDIAN